MRNQVIKSVQWFYICVIMSIKFWWIILKHIIVYGIVAATTGVIIYYSCSKEEKDLHQSINKDTVCKLSKSGYISFIASLLISIWTAVTFLIIKWHFTNIIIVLMFLIFTIWSIILLTYIINLGLILANKKYKTSKQYYLEALINIIKMPQLSVMIVLLWIVFCILFVKNVVIAFLVMPGVFAACVCKAYKMIQENN